MLDVDRQTDDVTSSPAFDASFAVVAPLRDSMAMTFDRMDGDGIDASWSVGPDTHQPYGIVHGGVHAMVVEGLCSMAAALWLGDDGRVVGVSNTTDFYRAVTEGRLTSVTRPVHRGRSQQVWTVDTTDADGRLVAHGQVRLQNLR
ncbi:PaaI family thioesterase [Nocardioides aestuarii]